jgi:hypothetical protein
VFAGENDDGQQILRVSWGDNTQPSVYTNYLALSLYLQVFRQLFLIRV